MVSGSSISVRLVQPSKAYDPITLILTGIVTSDNFVQFRKTLLSIVFIRYAARKPDRLVLQDEYSKVYFVL